MKTILVADGWNIDIFKILREAWPEATLGHMPMLFADNAWDLSKLILQCIDLEVPEPECAGYVTPISPPTCHTGYVTKGIAKWTL